VEGPGRLRLALVLFTLSGAAGLAYEVLWMRRLSLLFGADAPAASATLAAWFLGLALGSAASTRIAGRVRSLRAFGILEIGVALFAALVPASFSLIERALPSVASFAGATGVMPLWTKFLLAMMPMLPATVLMGASLPVLLAGVTAWAGPAGQERGAALYAANTAGAAAGALAVPTLLLPFLDASSANTAACLLSAAAGISAVIAAGRMPAGGAGEMAASARSGAGPARPKSAIGRLATPGLSRSSLLAGALVSGLLVLAFETAGARALALIHENSLYSFAFVLAVVLAGLALGAALAHRLRRSGTTTASLLRAGWIGGALAVAATPATLLVLTDGLTPLEGADSAAAHALKLGAIAAALLPASLLSGLVLPALIDESAGRPAAVLAANTLGAIAGPVLALVFAGPIGGPWRTMALVAGLMAAGGALVRPSGGAAGAAAAACAVWLWVADPPRTHLVANEHLRAVYDSPFGTLAVVEDGSSLRLNLNNTYLLGGTLSTGEERLQAHLPLLLHPHPRSAGFIGMGTGITAGGAVLHPLDRIVVMELVPEVVEAARAHFGAANLGLADDPRVRIESDDARSRLRGEQGRFDVLIGDLVVPWRRGEAALYTRESFVIARAALAPGGVFCQWVPLYQMSRSDCDAIIAAFTDVFPRAIVVRGDFRAYEPAIGLVGLTSEAAIDPADVARRLAEMRRPDEDNPYLADAAGVWAYLVGPLFPAPPAAPRNTDDNQLVELGSPQAHWRASRGEPSVFTGEALRPWLADVMSRPIEGTSLARLGPAELQAREAGSQIWLASLLDYQGRRDEADRMGLAALARLPAGIRAALGVPDRASPEISRP